MKTQPGRCQIVLWRLLSLAALAAAWQALAAAYGDARLFPGLVRVATRSFPEMALFAPGRSGPDPAAALGVLGGHSRDTILRIAAGLAVGAPLGIAAGSAAHLFYRTARANALVLMSTRAVPLMGLIPLFAYWFGNRETGALAYIAFGAFVVMSSATYEAVRGIAPESLELARMLGASPARRILTVYPFATQRQLFPALRDLVGLSWALSLGAEYVAATSGLGFLARQSYLYADMGKLLIVAGVYCLYGLASTLVVTGLTRRLGAWNLPSG